MIVDTRSETVAKWSMTKDRIISGGPELERVTAGFWSRVWVRYTDAFSGLARHTEVEENTLGSQLFFNERDISMDGGTVVETAAEMLQKLGLEQAKRLQTKSEISIKGTVLNKWGASEPVTRIRAGDLITIPDLMPLPNFQVGLPTIRNSMQTFLVRQTDYDAGSGEMSITTDIPPDRLSLVVAQLSSIPSLSSTGSMQLGGVSEGPINPADSVLS